jgi:hypothetical protein
MRFKPVRGVAARPLLFVLLLVLHTTLARAYSSLPGSCTASAFYPVHGTAQSGNGGFALASSSPTYAPGQLISITLSGTQGFKGLLLYAFDSMGDHRGTFAIPSGYQAMSGCGGDAMATLGQANGTFKSVPVGFNWTAPTSSDPLTVVAVVAVDIATFYVLNPITIPPAAGGVDAQTATLDAQALLLRAAPNPFVRSTSIEYTLGVGGPASVRIYDMMGRLVRTLTEDAQAAGLHSLDWDGRDDRGVDLGTGLYFVRLDAAGDSRACKILRLEGPSATR